MLPEKSPQPRPSAQVYELPRRASDTIDERTALRREVDQLRHQLEQERERERRRIAREMHDSTVQDLVAIGLMLRRLQDIVAEPEAQAVLGDVRGTLGRTQQELRTLSYLLHPPVLGDEGLVVALRTLVRGLSSRMTVRIELECDVPAPRTSANLENALYRVVQEALINVHKHSCATVAVVRLFGEPGLLVLEIEDDGIGMDTDCDPALSSGVGIQAMLARMAQFGGTLQLVGGGSGLLVRAEVPTAEVDWGRSKVDDVLLPKTAGKEG